MRKTAKRGISPKLVKTILIRGGLIFFLAIMQCSFFSALKPFGGVPDLMLGLVIFIALTSSFEETAVCSLAAGYIIDALGASGLSFTALFYLLISTLASLLAKKVMPAFPSYAVLLIPAFILKALYTSVQVVIMYRKLPPIMSLLNIAVPEVISGIIFCIPLYFLLKLCSIPLEVRGKFTFR